MDFIEKKINELMENQTHMLEAIIYLDERLKKVEDETVDNQKSEVKDIFESQAMLDEIIVKNSDDILVMKKSKQDNDVAIKKLDAKIDEINRELEMTRKEIKDKDEIKDKEETTNTRPKSIQLLNPLKCKLCDKSFHRFADLENHIKSDHEKHQEFKCDMCGKCFVLNWRLSKHMRLHTDENVRHCYYFNNDKECPFEALGCKFLHAEAKSCHFGQNCKRKLCPLKHIEEVSNTTKDEELINETEDTDTSDEEVSSHMPFMTSTPQKVNYDCEECEDKEQCTDCFVRQVNASGQSMHGDRHQEKRRRVHF